MEALVTDSTAQHNTDYVRDNNYYFNDGSVILLVENRLFKIHKSLFERSSAFFQTLFSLPQGTDDVSDSDLNHVEGRSDENPIVCRDSVEDFEALCWAVYTSPPEILEQQNWDTVNVSKMISVVAMSHKYDFTVLREWALGVLDAYSAASSGNVIKKWRQWPIVVRIFNLANQCKKETLTKSIERDWLRHICDSGSSDLTAFEQALDVAERSNDLRIFHGKIYYAFLKATNIFDIGAQRNITPLDIEDVASYTDPSLLELSHERKLRISQGFWSLSLLRPRLSQAPQLDDNPLCSNHDSCKSGWQTWWENLLNQVERRGRSLNPGEIIEEVQQRIVGPIRGRNSSRAVDCDELIRVRVVQMVQNFFDGLADRFMIPRD